MKCIYCKEPTTGTEGDAHIFPEAIVKNNYTLPKGTVCDGCNNYLSSLESVLILHNHIGPIIQLLGLKGKKGKERQKIGYFERHETGVHLHAKQEEIFSVSQDERRLIVHIKDKTEFDDLKFRRALYGIAFNFTALQLSNEEILQKPFDAVRKYIRAPKPQEKWPYCQVMCETWEGVFEVYTLSSGNLLVCVRIFHNEFYVDLLQPWDLHERFKRDFKEKTKTLYQ